MYFNLHLKKIKSSTYKLKFNLDKLQDAEAAQIFKEEEGLYGCTSKRTKKLVSTLKPPFSLHLSLKQPLRSLAYSSHWKNLGPPVICSTYMTSKEPCGRTRTLQKALMHTDKSIKKNTRKDIQSAKQNWINEKCQEIENSLNTNNTKKRYQAAKELKMKKQTRVSAIQSKTGECLTEQQKILERLTKYCSELYNHRSSGDQTVLAWPQPMEEGETLPIFRE